MHRTNLTFRAAPYVNVVYGKSQAARDSTGFASPRRGRWRCEAASCARHWKSTGPSDHLSPLTKSWNRNELEVARGTRTPACGGAAASIPMQMEQENVDVCVLEEEAVETFADADNYYACLYF